ncbi:hypothetical protein GGF43_004913, partial [Coemansia sp. RSA 2618]
MNQNPFAFFSADPAGYAQLPDPLGQSAYLEAHSIKEESLHTSTMSNDSDSSPSSPSKSRKADRRTPKSKAEVSERMRRWRSENAEKNRLNDLRCRVYRQARIRFGKEPTPEREAWIQSEIFRRLERRRLREAMKGNGSVPAPTAIANPIDMGHMNGGPLTRSRSTVHGFPMHMQNGVADHAMAFPASPYSMMYGSQPQQQVQYAQHHAPQQQQHQPHSAYLPPQYAHGYHHHAQPPPQSHDFSASSADLYNSFKFINPLYPGRLLPPQNNMSSAPPQPPQQPPMQHQHQHDAIPHSVPSHQPLPDMATSNAAAAAAAAAVVDFSGAFQLPPQGSYAYYNDNIPAFEAASSANASHNQSHSTPSTPTDTVASAQPHYALVAPSSPAATSSAASAFTSLSMVDPIAPASANANNMSPSLNDVASNLFSLRQVAAPRTDGNPDIEVSAVDRLAVVAAAAAADNNAN